MQIRMTQGFAFQRIREGLQSQFADMVTAQRQISSGQRLHRPSDDPAGTARLLGLDASLGQVTSERNAIAATRPVMDAAGASLQQATDIMAEARAVLLGAMNGTMDAGGRSAVADQLQGARDALLALANTRFGDQFVFGGTDVSRQPFVEITIDGEPRVVYQGGNRSNVIGVGNGQTIESTVAGAAIFGRSAPTGIAFSGLTGVAPGTGPSDGSGYVTLDVRHDATLGALGAGLAFVSAGAGDTILGDKALVVDSVAGTVQLGDGPAVLIPAAGASNLTDLRVVDTDGSELHLDFSGYSGGDFSGTVSGAGSISLDGTLYVPLDFVDDNLRLTDASGRLIHVDTRGISRSGPELAAFGGTLSVFDVLDGTIADLRGAADLELSALQQRLATRLEDLDVAAEDIVLGLGELGARADRLGGADARLGEVEVGLQSVISQVRDTDVIDAVTRLSQAEQSLQVAQAAGARILQQTLLNFL